MPRYQILAGQHVDKNGTHRGPRHGVENGQQVILPGEIFESDELLEKFNADGLDPKFMRLDFAQAPQQPRKVVDLGAMSVDELLAFAGEEEIEIADGNKTDKRKLLDTIRAALGAR